MARSDRIFVGLSLIFMLLTALSVNGTLNIRSLVPTKAPQAEIVSVDKPSIQLDDIPSGSICTHDFALTNNSSEGIALAVEKRSCSCMDVSLVETSLAPQESTSVSIAVDVADQPSFDVMAAISVMNVSQTKRLGAVNLRMAGNVNTNEGLSPSIIKFGKLRRGTEPASRDIQFRFADWEEAKILDERLKRLESGLSIHFDDPPEATGKDVVIRGKITLDPDLMLDEVTQVDRAIEIPVERGESKVTYRVKLTAEIVPELQITPDALFWSRHTSNSPIQVRFDALQGEAITVGEIEPEKPGLLKWTIKDNGTAAPVLTIHCSPIDSSESAIRTKLRIQLRCGDKTTTALLPVVIL